MERKEKGLVVLSGGQDSATCLAMAAAEREEIYAVSFDYGQKHIKELQCASKLVELAGVKEHRIVNLKEAFGSLNSVSALTNPQMDISGAHPLNNNLPASFVPGRNFFLLGFAAVVAYNLGIKYMYAGMNQEDFSGYPDCRSDSITMVGEALRLCLDYPIHILTPLIYLKKKQIVERMMFLDKLEWYRYTMTCYNGEYPPCGTCPSCKLRAKGFAEAGIADPIFDYRHEGAKLL